MALWIDGEFIFEEDLQSIDGEALDIADAESITLSGSQGILIQATQEAGFELLTEMVPAFQSYILPPGVTWQHQVAVWNTGLQQNQNSSRIQLAQVVVSGPFTNQWSILKRWVVYRALLQLYRSAAERKINDRYQAKFDRLATDVTNRMTPMLLNYGIPIVTNPLPRPGAKYFPNSGTFTSANVTAISGGSNPQTQYVVAVTYTGSGYVTQTTTGIDAESAPSDLITFTLPLNDLLQVDISTLVPPTSTQPTILWPESRFSPMAATGWNVYVGLTTGPMFLQTATPNPIATTTYAFAAAPVLSGKTMGQGQKPDALMTVQRTIFRG